MPCDCISVMDAKLAKHNTRLVPSFAFPQNGGQPFDTVTLTIEKIQPRNRDRVRAAATFCPFCGVRYVPETPVTPADEARP